MRDMQVGDEVTIFEDPIMETKPEGRATLLERVMEVKSIGTQIWRVRLQDGMVRERQISILSKQKSFKGKEKPRMTKQEEETPKETVEVEDDFKESTGGAIMAKADQKKKKRLIVTKKKEVKKAKGKKVTRAKTEAAKTSKKKVEVVGVIASIVQHFSHDGFRTKESAIKMLEKSFPERPIDSMKGTLAHVVHGRFKECRKGEMEVEEEDGKYRFVAA